MVKKSSKEKTAFDEEVYKRLGINQLIIFSIYSMVSDQKECTFEGLIKKCFTFFPKVFSFSKFPQWPDSRKLDRPLRTLRNKKLIKGDPKTSFSLTKSGKKIAQEIVTDLRQKKLL